MSSAIVIPARMASTRLPGKPLAMINGRPMIAHVVQRALDAELGEVIVACSEAEVAHAATHAGAKAVLTDPGLPSGSDRVWAALQEADPQGRFRTIINLQGDLPTITPETIKASLFPLADPSIAIGTLVARIHDDEEAKLESVVKCACAFTVQAPFARALYFSRQVIPWGHGPLWHHIGIYAYRREALAQFIRLPPSPLEEREKLEQLRALEAGIPIGVAAVSQTPFGVDTPADLDRARKALENS